jgi:hypothetical protein
MFTARPWRRPALAIALALSALAAIAPVASAAEPGATTAGAAVVTPSSATLTGSVDPRGLATTYRFQYGTTARYGGLTPTTAAGAGSKAVTAVGEVTALAPNTTYHYRISAHNRDGTTHGADRTFRTQRQPLGLTLNAAPNPVPYGQAVIIGGILTGTGNSGRQVQILQNAFPYTAGFTPVGSPVVTNADGGFSLAVPALPVTTQFRARLVGDTATQSAILTAPVAIRVTTGITIGKRTPAGRRLVRFAGRIRPARDGARYAIQRRSKAGDHWITVAGGITHRDDATSSKYVQRIRVRHSGTYRVYVQLVDGNYVSAAGREITITLKKAR